MKKFLLIALSLFAASTALSAKELTFYLGNEAVPANGEVSYDGYEIYDDFGQVEYFIKPDLSIMKDEAGSVSMKTVSNYPIQLCIGGQCEAAETVVKNNLNFAVNTKEDLLLDCSVFFNEGEEITLPKIKVEIEAWYTSDPTNVTKMTLNMGDVAGVKAIGKDKNRVTMVGNTLSYSLEGSANIIVFNLSGRAVGRYSVKGNGSVSLASLPVGIYLYRVEGAAVPAGKFIIR